MPSQSTQTGEKSSFYIVLVPLPYAGYSHASGILGQLVLFDFGLFYMARELTAHVLNDQEARLLQHSQLTKARKPQKP